MGGRKYYKKIFKEIKREKFDFPVVFELFTPLTDEFADDLKNTFYHYNLEMSPEDASEYVRYNIGKGYTNVQLVDSIEKALTHNCEKFDIFFMIGLGKQKKENVYKTLQYIDSLLEKFENKDKKKIYPFISPYAPTLDPGCIAFEDPEKYGYKVIYRTLEEQYEAFKNPSWKQFFNYKTEYMDAEDIVNLTYQSAMRMTDIKEKHGLMKREDAERIRKNIEISEKIMKRIDEIKDKNGNAGLLKDDLLNKWKKMCRIRIYR